MGSPARTAQAQFSFLVKLNTSFEGIKSSFNSALLKNALLPTVNTRSAMTELKIGSLPPHRLIVISF